MIDDAETAAFLEVAKREAPFAMFKQTGLMTVGSDVPLRPEIETWLQGRVEWVKAGIEKCPKWFKKNLEAFDPNLRVRWDSYKHHWIIEHRSPTDNLYHRCGTWDQPLGFRLIEKLRESDMQRTTTEEKIQQAETRAAKQQEVNEQKTRDGWLTAVDSLTRKKQEEFIEVSRALEHGESLTFAGPDADMMNKIFDDKKKGE